MKISLLHVSALFVVLILIPGFSNKIIFSVILILLSFFLFRQYFLLVLGLCLIVHIHFYFFHTLPDTQEYKVYEIHQNYAIVGSRGRKILLYHSEALTIGDSIIITEKPQKLEDVTTFFHNGYRNWYLRKRLNYFLQNPKIEIKQHHKNIQSILYARISNLNNLEMEKFLKKVFFGVNDDTLSDFLLSTGMGIFALYYGGKRLLSFLFQPKGIKIYAFCFAVISVACFSYWLIGLRIILNEFILKNKKNPYERTAWYILIVLSINPFFIYHPMFYFPLLFMLQGVFNKKRNRLDQAFVLIPLYLSAQYQVNLLEVFFFRIYQNYIGILALLGFVCIIFQLPFPLKHIYLLNRLTLPALTITGNMNMMLIFLWYYLLFKRKTKKYVLLCLVLLYIHHQSLFNPFFEITQLYIGQGDCAVIRFPFRDEVVIIDTGSHHNWEYLNDFLLANSIKKIGVLVTTHNDEDHSGNLEQLRNTYPIGNMISKQEEMQFQGVQFYFLNQTNDYDNENDNSIVIYFTVGGLNYLYLGDISLRIEELLLKEYPQLNPNIVKLAHHGSKTGTSNRLLEKSELYLALISSGLNNYYGHPNNEVLKKLERAQLPYLNTQDVGDIQIISFLNVNLLITSGFRFAII